MTSCVTKEVPISCTIDLNTVNNILPEVSNYYPLNVFTEINSLFYMNFFNSNNKTRPIVAKTDSQLIQVQWIWPMIVRDIFVDTQTL